MSLETIDVSELRSRMETILNRVELLFVQIGPSVKEIGNLREEASFIYDELRRRNLPLTEKPEESDVT